MRLLNRAGGIRCVALAATWLLALTVTARAQERPPVGLGLGASFVEGANVVLDVPLGAGFELTARVWGTFLLLKMWGGGDVGLRFRFTPAWFGEATVGAGRIDGLEQVDKRFAGARFVVGYQRSRWRFWGGIFAFDDRPEDLEPILPTLGFSWDLVPPRE